LFRRDAEEKAFTDKPDRLGSTVVVSNAETVGYGIRGVWTGVSGGDDPLEEGPLLWSISISISSGSKGPWGG
jgi:hypothetical protein